MCIRFLSFGLTDQLARVLTLRTCNISSYSPLKQCCGEISGLEERARYMTRVAKESLSDLKIEDKAGFRRYIRKEAVGPVLVIR